MNKLLLLILLLISSYTSGADNMLKVDKAFQLSIEATNRHFITATWKIADGYYMYRKRFSFSTDTPNVTLGKPIFPEGELKEDPNFGRVIIYRNSVSIKIPIKDSSNNTGFKLNTKSQGCGDLGIYYPPQKVSLKIKLPKGNSTPKEIIDTENTTPTPLISLFSKKPSNLTKDFGVPTFGRKKNNTEPLPPDEAFAFDISALDKQTLNAHWQITPGHYLYQKKIRFRLLDAQGIELGKWTLPKGKIQKDPTYGDTVVYYKDFEVKIPLIGKAASITIKTGYQGCSKLTGICYPPQNKTQTIDLSSAAEPVNTQNLLDINNLDNNEKISKQQRFTNILKGNNLLAISGLFFLAGLALTFTPCIFPMIPILSGIISGQGDHISKKKAFVLSLAYVLPMALTYAVVGVLAGLSGKSLTATLQTPWVITTFALLFVMLAFAMFGFYELQMPSRIQNKLATISHRQKGGTLVGAAVMGMLSALIVGPCVTAPLAGALIFIADTKDALLGGLSLFMLGIGMGIPLLMIGTVAGGILPKAGAWMDNIKAIFGVLMLGLAIWMLERILPIEITILLTATLLITSAIYMKALDNLNSNATGWDRLWKALGIILLLYGIVLIVGVTKGNKSFFYPLKNRTITQQISKTPPPLTERLKFTPIKGIKGLDLALEQASTQNKPLILDFYANWCISCKEMEYKVFTDPRIIKALEGSILVQADVTEHDDLDIALMKKFDLFGPPSLLFFDTKKQEYPSFRIIGEISADDFFSHINKFFKKIQFPKNTTTPKP